MSADESIPALTGNQINALVVLMAEARELTNNELKELAGFSLTGTDNAKLVTHGLVTTDKSHRPFSHALTDKGRSAVRKLHTGGPPKSAGSATRSLLTLLANLDRSLDRLHTSTDDFFKQVGEAQNHTVEETQSEPVDIESHIRSAYADVTPASGEWVGLADLRDRLGGIDRQAVDDTLRAMVGRRGVRIIPVANTKSLQPRDREAALRIGNEDNHALLIGES